MEEENIKQAVTTEGSDEDDYDGDFNGYAYLDIDDLSTVYHFFGQAVEANRIEVEELEASVNLDKEALRVLNSEPQKVPKLLS
jgi:hypothetical protein